MNEIKHAAKLLIDNPQHFRHAYRFRDEVFFASECEIERGQIHLGVLDNSIHIKECLCKDPAVKRLLAQ